MDLSLLNGLVSSGHFSVWALTRFGLSPASGGESGIVARTSNAVLKIRDFSSLNFWEN